MHVAHKPPRIPLCLFAVARIGAVLVPINSRFRTRDMAYIVMQSDATTLTSADRARPVDYLAKFDELVPSCVTRGQAHGPRRLPQPCGG